MNVSLTPEIESIINEKVTSGMYNSASEVVREGIRLLQERDEYRKIKLDNLRNEINKGVDDLKNSRFRDGKESMSDIRSRVLNDR